VYGGERLGSLIRRRSWTLRQLVDALRSGTDPDSVSYDFPELREPSFLSACMTMPAEL
jgi:uncharacterized protein (DUF433 family)